MSGQLMFFRDIPYVPEPGKLSLGALLDTVSEEDWEEIRKAARPKAVVLQVAVSHAPDGKVTGLDGVPVSSSLLDRNLSGCHRAFVYAATCGTELAELEPEDVGLQYAMFQICSQAAVAAKAYASAQLRQRYGIGKLSALSPGSLPEWPIQAQKDLFALLGEAASAIGMRLTDSMLMLPAGSVSGLLYETEEEFHNCQLCPRKDCPGRRAPYDPTMSDAFRGAASTDGKT